MSDHKKYYCKNCDREITVTEKKDFNNLCSVCANMEESGKYLKKFILLSIPSVSILSILIWFGTILILFIIERATNGHFFMDWVYIYRNYNFYDTSVKILMQPAIYSVLNASFIYYFMISGKNKKKKLNYYMFYIILEITIMITYVFSILILG